MLLCLANPSLLRLCAFCVYFTGYVLQFCISNWNDFYGNSDYRLVECTGKNPPKLNDCC